MLGWYIRDKAWVMMLMWGFRSTDVELTIIIRDEKWFWMMLMWGLMSQMSGWCIRDKRWFWLTDCSLLQRVLNICPSGLHTVPFATHPELCASRLQKNWTREGLFLILIASQTRFVPRELINGSVAVMTGDSFSAHRHQRQITNTSAFFGRKSSPHDT